MATHVEPRVDDEDPEPSPPRFGDEEYRRIVEAVTEVCIRRGLGQQKQEEIAHDAAVYVWEHYVETPEPFDWATLRGWAWARVGDVLDKRRRHYEGEVDIPAEETKGTLAAPVSVWSTPDARLAEEELNARIDRVIARMPKRQRACYEGAEGGETGEALAEQLGISKNTVWAQVTRGRKAIREDLEPDYPIPEARRAPTTGESTDEGE